VHRGCTSEHCWVQTETCRGTEAKIIKLGEEDLKVVESLGGKAMYEEHSCRQNSAVNSIELCQVGIEHMHKVQLKELYCEFKRNRITEDSGRICQEGIEQVQRVCRRDITVERSVEKILCQEGVEKVCR
jgi:hypothetical protein